MLSLADSSFIGSNYRRRWDEAAHLANVKAFVPYAYARWLCRKLDGTAKSGKIKTKGTPERDVTDDLSKNNVSYIADTSFYLSG